MAKFTIPRLNLVSFLLLVIILCSAFFRLYRVGELHTFHNDEGRDVMIAQEMINSGKPTLLGPQTSVGNMYLGPLYYYLMVPSLLLSQGDPVGPAIMVGLSGVLTTYLIFLLSRKWFGSSSSALISSGIFAISPLFVHYTASSWNPNLVPLVAILILLAWERQSYLIIGILFGVLFQLHYVAMAYALVVALALFVINKNLRFVPLLTLGFFISTAPFWLFEVRHDFLNIQALFSYLEGSGVKNGSTAPYIQRVASNAGDIITNIVLSRTFTYNSTNLFLSLTTTEIIFMSLPWFMSKTGQKSSFKLWYLLISTLLVSSILREKLYPHYLGYLFPVISLLIGSLVCSKYKLVRTVGFVYALVWTIYSAPVTIKALGGEGSMQKLKGIEVAGYIMRDSGGKPYNVVASPSNSRETTYLYYLRRLSNSPSISPEKLLYIICEDAPCTDKDAQSPLIFARGVAHPYLDSTLTHPYLPISESKKAIISTTHIVYGVWVARVIVGE